MSGFKPTRQAFDIQAPHTTVAPVFILATATTHAVYGVPESLLDCMTEWEARGEDIVLNFGATPAIEADRTATAAATVVAADTDSIVTSRATSASALSLSGVALNGIIGAGTISPTRVPSITQNNHADHVAVVVTFTGTDSDGNTITDRVTTVNGGNTTVYGTKHFRTFSLIDIPAMSGAGGLFEIGTTASLTAAAVGCIHIPSGEAVPLRLMPTKYDRAGNVVVAGDLFFSMEAPSANGFLHVYRRSRVAA